MKKIAVILAALAGLLSGCVVYDDRNRNDGRYRGDRDSQSHHGDHDRDRDGVQDRQDRRPNDPGRY